MQTIGDRVVVSCIDISICNLFNTCSFPLPSPSDSYLFIVKYNLHTECPTKHDLFQKWQITTFPKCVLPFSELKET